MKWFSITKCFRGGRNEYFATMPDGKRMQSGGWKTQLNEWGESINGGHESGWHMTSKTIKEPADHMKNSRKMLSFDFNNFTDPTPELSADRHIYLYAKRHYEMSNNVWSDLAKIMADRYLLPVESITHEDIMSMLLLVTVPHLLDTKQDSATSVINFLQNLLPNRAFLVSLFNNPSYERRVVSWCLSTLHYVDTQLNGVVVINLGEPDPNILPLKK